MCGKRTSSCADLLAPIVIAVQPIAVVTDRGMTIPWCGEVWDSAGKERIEGKPSSGGVQVVKECVESARPHELTSLHPVWKLCIKWLL